MKTPHNCGFLIRLVYCVFSGIALVGFAVTADAAKFRCSIADPGPITTGTSVTFTGNVSGDTQPYYGHLDVHPGWDLDSSAEHGRARR
jgi:hypothetical protein